MSDDLSDLSKTRRSWNIATRNHNAHKGDQAALLRSGRDVLFPEELELLGPLQGLEVAHLQCNSGQDSLGLARRGARVTAVDFSDEAIAFARKLSADSGIAAEFVESEIIAWLSSTERRFDVAFTSYGTTPWLRDLSAWARGVARILKPGGRLVYVEFHPLTWSIKPDFALRGDDYFATEPFRDPVNDYVVQSGAGLGAVTRGETVPNTEPATSWQHTVAQVVDSLVQAGLAIEALREWPYSNGCRTIDSLIDLGDRRWGWPPGVARVPLMYGVSAKKP
ncbi:MAG: class I SAM-dependent methyltransferase [Archangium sp.]|nr:class I SAM-dependent methyltransferase [Archangium sp.]